MNYENYKKPRNADATFEIVPLDDAVTSGAPESENATQAPVVVPVSGAALSLGMKDEPTMSSREIAELCEKDHRNVLRDIRAVLEEAEIGALKFERTYLDAQNKERPCYHLPRFECDLVVSGYSVKYRAAIIRRWHELEAKEAQGVPQTFSEALQLAADLAKQSEKQMLQLEAQSRTLEEQQPAVDFFNRYVVAAGNYNITQVAKICGRKRKRFIAACVKHKILYKELRKDRLLPNAPWCDEEYGYFKVLTGEKNGHATLQTMFSAKGVAWVGQLLDKKEPKTNC